MDVIVTAADLAAELDADPDRLVLLDVRWSLGGPPGHDEYLEGHLPGAVFVDLDHELAAPPSPERGRHPLPEVADLQAAARRWGIDDDSRVVAYDASGNLAAARAWWLLRWAGHDDVRLLDGGLAAWTATGAGLETRETIPHGGQVSFDGAGRLPTVELDAVPGIARDGLLLDARAPERFRGEVEPVDPKAGHVPGARNLPTGSLLDAHGRFLPREELRARFTAVGADGGERLTASCGSGVTAAHLLAAASIAGLEGALYPGSWSQYSAHDLPVATGG